MTDKDPAVVAARSCVAMEKMQNQAYYQAYIRNAYAPMQAELDAKTKELAAYIAAYLKFRRQSTDISTMKQQRLDIALKELAAAQEEIERLREFVEFFLDEIAWDNEPNGGTVQEVAERLKLIELRPCEPEDSIDGETEHYFCVWTPKKGAGDG